MKGRGWGIIIGGEGGQGVVLAGALLGEAAVRAGLNAANTSSYGIATRGGFTRSDVLVVPAEEEIAYPRVRHPDLVVALSPGAYERLLPACTPGTLLVRDSSLTGVGESAGTGPPADTGPCGATASCRRVAFPLEETARHAGGARVINMVALGVVLGVTGMFAPAFLEEVLRTRFAGERGETNCRAMQAGYRLVGAGSVGK